MPPRISWTVIAVAAVIAVIVWGILAALGLNGYISTLVGLAALIGLVALFHWRQAVEMEEWRQKIQEEHD